MTAAIDPWFEALVSAANELAVTTLGLESSAITAASRGAPLSLTSSFVALVGTESALQLGFSAGPAECSALAKALLAIAPEDHLSHEDTVDALGEIANILAGLVKARLASTWQIGLPMVVSGCVEIPSNMDTTTATVRWGSVQAQLLLLRGRGKAV